MKAGSSPCGPRCVSSSRSSFARAQCELDSGPRWLLRCAAVAASRRRRSARESHRPSALARDGESPSFRASPRRVYLAPARTARCRVLTGDRHSLSRSPPRTFFSAAEYSPATVSLLHGRRRGRSSALPSTHRRPYVSITAAAENVFQVPAGCVSSAAIRRRSMLHVDCTADVVRAFCIAASTRRAAATSERPASTIPSGLVPFLTTCS